MQCDKLSLKMNGYNFFGEQPNIETLLERANSLREKSPQESLILNQEALYLAEKLKDKNLWCRCIIDLAGSHYRLGQFPQAFTYAQQASKYKQSVNLHYLLGLLYLKLGDLDQALTYFFETLKNLEFEPDGIVHYGTLSEIGYIYNLQGTFDLELQAYEQLLEKLKPEQEFERAKPLFFQSLAHKPFMQIVNLSIWLTLHIVPMRIKLPRQTIIC